MIAQSETIGIIGGGAWGTALAAIAASQGRPAIIWARDAITVSCINEQQQNAVRLSGIDLPETLRATSDLADLMPCKAILMVCPAQAMRSVAQDLVHMLPKEAIIVNCAKGIERDTGKLMSEVIDSVLPGQPYAVLSGPGFAREVASGLPTATTIASTDQAITAALAERLRSSSFRPYLSNDPRGAEIGGALKNVLAIAAGIVAGRKLGASASAALVARSFAEMQRYASVSGARPESMAGLAGLGDLVLSTTSPQSRNYALGFTIGEGVAQLPMGDDMTNQRDPARPLAEGVWTAHAIARTAIDKGVDMPISTAVADVLAQRLTVGEAIGTLLARPLTKDA